MGEQKGLHVIIGLGKTGFSCIQHLVDNEVPVAVMDSHSEPSLAAAVREHYPQVACHFGVWDDALLQRATCIIASPGVPASQLRHYQQQGIEVIGDIELFARQATAPIIAITGTNAKSTVTTLVGEIVKKAGLQVAVGGNLGDPVLSLLAPEVQCYVIELSSFQLETTYSLAAHAATILNISADHLDRYPDFTAYIHAKHRIYTKAQAMISNRDDDHTWPLNASATFSFGASEPQADNELGLRKVNARYYLAKGRENLMAVDELPLSGHHHWQNYLAAIALALTLDIEMADILNALIAFKGLAHRCQQVATINDVTWYDDSKGTNIGATIAAIQGLSYQFNDIVLIAGGQGKGVDFAPLAPVVARYVSDVILLGEDAERIAQVMASDTRIEHVSSMAQAVTSAAQLAKPGGAVLLSPACASFDMFNNYQHRGDVFSEAVRTLNNE